MTEQNELPKHNIFPRAILDDVLILLAGQRYPTPEKGFTGWDDALSSLKRFIRERLNATQPAEDERVKEIRERYRRASIGELVVHGWKDIDYLLSLLPVQPEKENRAGGRLCLEPNAVSQASTEAQDERKIDNA